MSTNGKRIEHDIFGTPVRPPVVKGNRKGKTNERHLAKLIGEWTGLKFSRTPMSGGMHLRNAHFAGDLVCVDEGVFFPFVVETKHLKRLTIPQRAADGTPEKLKVRNMMRTVLDQAQRDADRVGKRPMALVRNNGMDRDEYAVVLPATIGTKLTRVRMIGYGLTLQKELDLNVFLLTEIRAAYTWSQFLKELGFAVTKKTPNNGRKRTE